MSWFEFWEIPDALGVVRSGCLGRSIVPKDVLGTS